MSDATEDTFNPNGSIVSPPACVILETLWDEGWETWHSSGAEETEPPFKSGFLFKRDGVAILVTVAAVKPEDTP
jgi:hypothetical protein